MIRINLLRGETKRARRVTKAAEPSELTKQLGFIAIVLVAVLIGAWLWFGVQGRKSELQQQVRTATAERERLKTIKEIVDRLELERARLAERLDVLSDLKNNLRTPLYPLFFLYLAQQNRPGVVFDEFVSRGEEEGRITYYTLKGESNNEELNRFMEDLSREAIVVAVDMVSSAAGKFEISIGFMPLNMLEPSLEEGDESEADEEESGGGS